MAGSGLCGGGGGGQAASWGSWCCGWAPCRPQRSGQQSRRGLCCCPSPGGRAPVLLGSLQPRSAAGMWYTGGSVAPWWCGRRRLSQAFASVAVVASWATALRRRTSSAMVVGQEALAVSVHPGGDVGEDLSLCGTASTVPLASCPS